MCENNVKMSEEAYKEYIFTTPDFVEYLQFYQEPQRWRPKI